MTSLVQTFDTELRFLPMKEIAHTIPVSNMDAVKQFYMSKFGFNFIFDRATEKWCNFCWSKALIRQ